MNTVQTFKSGDDIFLKSDNKCMMTYGMKKKAEIPSVFKTRSFGTKTLLWKRQRQW